MISMLVKGASIVAVVLASAAALPPTSPATKASAMQRADAILNSLGRLDPCPLNCEFSSCSGGGHSTFKHSSGNDGGEEHSCAWSANGCEDHNCASFSGRSQDVQTLAAALPELDGRQLLILATRYERLVLNKQRNAVQVLACGDKVVMSKQMTPSQVQDLGF